MTENRIHWADAARGMAIVLVALHHAVIYAGTFNLGNDVWIGVTEVLRTMRMPLFFMAAGLFAVKWVSADWRALFRSKLMLLGWVFALWVVIRWLWMNSIPGADSETGVRQLVLHMVWPLGGWFLFTLAALFVLARATLKIAPAAQLIAAGLLSAAWFSIDGGNLIGNNA